MIRGHFMWVLFFLVLLMTDMVRASVDPSGGSEDVRSAIRMGKRWVVGHTDGISLVDSGLSPIARLSAMDKLPGSRIHALTRDRQRPEVFFAGTEHGTAEVWCHGDTMTLKRTWPSAPVRALIHAEDALYAATFGDGLLRIGISDGIARPVPFLGTSEEEGSVEQTRMTALTIHRGTLYVATAGSGIFRLTGDALSRLPVDLPDDTVFSLASMDERLVCGTLAGLVSIQNQQSTLLTTMDVRALRRDGNSLLVGTFGEGLHRYQNGRWSRIPQAQTFVSIVIPSTKVPGEEVACIAVGGVHGFQVIEAKAGAILAIGAKAPRCANISAMTWEDAKLWVGYFDCGLGYWEDGRWYQEQNPLFARINGLAVERRGSNSRLWIATDHGLFAKDKNQGRLLQYRDTDGLPHNNVHSVFTLKSGDIAVGTTKGAALITKQGHVKKLGYKHSLPERAVWAIAEDHDGHIWFGTIIGLYRYNPVTTCAKRYSVSSGALPDDWVTALQIDDSYVWAGTYAKGVSRIPLNQDAGTAIPHLGGGYVNPGGLYIEEGRLYAATMSGLLFLDTKLNTPTWSVKHRAAPGIDVTCLASKDNRLWIGSRRGMGILAAKP